MKYLIIALLNFIYGVTALSLIDPTAPGYFLIFSISICLAILGLVGLVLYFMKIFSDKNEVQISRLSNWFSITKNIDIVLILGIVFRIFILQPFIVDGSSMEPNFHNNEYILVDQISYRFKAPDHGDVVVFHPPGTQVGTDYIKRVIGLPGETVRIENSKIFVNNRLLVENYTNPITKPNDNKDYTLGSDQYFVMGDNRDHSSDSRDFGAIGKESIVGKAWLIVYPFDQFGINKKPAFSYQP